MFVASQVNTNLNKHNIHLKTEAKRNNPFVYIKYLIQETFVPKNEVTDQNPCEHIIYMYLVNNHLQKIKANVFYLKTTRLIFYGLR